jgi:hypothetical protein
VRSAAPAPGMMAEIDWVAVRANLRAPRRAAPRPHAPRLRARRSDRLALSGSQDPDPSTDVTVTERRGARLADL